MIITVIGVPEQPPALGVIVYVAVPGVVPVAVNTCPIVVPELAVAPETPDWDTVQLNVVPTMLLVKLMPVEPPEHIDCELGVAVAIGSGFTVMVTDTGVPEQPPTEGVIVYTTVPAVVPVADNV